MSLRFISQMSRTHRSDYYNKAALRKPKTRQEIKQLSNILDDVKSGEYEVSGMNHLHHRLSVLPTDWDDLVISAYYQKP